MTEPTSSRIARFHIGDRVRAIGPSVQPRVENLGIVTEIVSSIENAVYRYRVKFVDDSTDVFYGFELEIVEVQ